PRSRRGADWRERRNWHSDHWIGRRGFIFRVADWQYTLSAWLTNQAASKPVQDRIVGRAAGKLHASAMKELARKCVVGCTGHRKVPACVCDGYGRRDARVRVLLAEQVD